jgi:sulfoxide reductase catalytic subunit YedY
VLRDERHESVAELLCGVVIRFPRVTTDNDFLNRRAFLGGAAGAAALAFAPSAAFAQRVTDIPDPTKDLYPAKRNEKYNIGDRPTTPEEINGNYNNFYEFGSSKTIATAAQALAIRPWTVKIDGMVEKPMEIGIDDLIRKLTLEERTYRHRCVEAWSMAVPWSGFPLAKLVELAKPLSAAKYLRMETFLDTTVAPAQKQTWYPWPYVEGLTMAEATNELAFLATGAYGKPIAKQHGAPLRLAVPWKYGFKHAKSIVKIRFVENQPLNSWQRAQSNEYGFYANVNPEVDHPRWSQATERMIDTADRVKTQVYNGYGKYVSNLYPRV